MRCHYTFLPAEPGRTRYFRYQIYYFEAYRSKYLKYCKLRNLQGNVTAKTLETFQIVATLLNALHISLNIIVYASCNPPYMAELFVVLEILCLKTKKQSVERIVDDGCCKNHRHKALVPYEPKSAAAKNCSQTVQICLVHGAIQMCVTTTTKFNSFKGGVGEYTVCNCLPIDLKEPSTTADNDCKELFYVEKY